ncbi:hypothetical protein PUN28_010729 [Cardiocondyla obscurior]|uniref:Uncharacterized protein n=1 Tax=Cardiocondyla obscurior TaxID=286306 RepID=A0AAW2FL48_9HYME
MIRDSPPDSEYRSGHLDPGIPTTTVTANLSAPLQKKLSETESGISNWRNQTLAYKITIRRIETRIVRESPRAPSRIWAPASFTISRCHTGRRAGGGFSLNFRKHRRPKTVARLGGGTSAGVRTKSSPSD